MCVICPVRCAHDVFRLVGSLKLTQTDYWHYHLWMKLFELNIVHCISDKSFIEVTLNLLVGILKNKYLTHGLPTLWGVLLKTE